MTEKHFICSMVYFIVSQITNCGYNLDDVLLSSTLHSCKQEVYIRPHKKTWRTMTPNSVNPNRGGVIYHNIAHYLDIK